MKRAYQEKRFGAAARAAIEQANTIIAEYQAAGYELTLRQLYYQHVARGFLPNLDRSYKNLGALISDARMAGLIDWDAIVARTRHLRSSPSWKDPAAIVQVCARQFAIARWADQP